jgi:peptidoglycan/xylan/chitin deacetylase (PgdA/CDA1 family)
VSMKQSAKTGIAVAWDAVHRLVPAAPKLTILYYHSVPTRLRQAFDAQMAYLKAAANLVAPDHMGALAFDRPNVAVTFDDAFRSVLENGLPALERHVVPATIFVPSGYLGRAPGWAMETAEDRAEVVMSAQELTALPSNLVSIGSHTVDHPHLTALSDDEVAAQFSTSRKVLEGVLGRVVDTLAFPYGDHDVRILRLARESGYRFAYTVAPQAIGAGDTTLSRGRTSASPGDSPRLFALKVRGAFDWMPIASRLKRALRVQS